MKTIAFAAFLLMGGAAVAQQADPLGVQQPPVVADQATVSGDAQMTAPAGPVTIQRSEAVAPPGYNMVARDVPPEVAASIISQLSTFDYPPCSAGVEDRCIQQR